VDQSTDIAIQVEPIGIEEAHALPLSDLPKLTRITAEQKAAISYEWSVAYYHFKVRRNSLVNYYHREEGLGITAAEIKADIDPSVIEAGEYSRRLKERIAAFEIVERQLSQEFEVKLALARSGEINLGRP
jgi:hypothetical protein